MKKNKKLQTAEENFNYETTEDTFQAYNDGPVLRYVKFAPAKRQSRFEAKEPPAQFVFPPQAEAADTPSGKSKKKKSKE